MTALPDGFTADPDRLLALAGEALDAVAPRFIEGVGAPASVAKGPADFATDLDLELERRITAAVAEATGVPVHGEEYGGPAVDEGTVWVLDPIDGTFNYSAGYPATGTLLGLLHDGKPVAGLAWFPLVGDTFAGHVAGPVRNRGEVLPRLAHGGLDDAMIAVGSFSRGSNGHFPGDFRYAILGEVPARARVWWCRVDRRRPRVHRVRRAGRCRRLRAPRLGQRRGSGAGPRRRWPGHRPRGRGLARRFRLGAGRRPRRLRRAARDRPVGGRTVGLPRRPRAFRNPELLDTFEGGLDR